MAISMTADAVSRVRAYASARGKPQVVRIGVKTTGCSGLAYTMELAGEQADGDAVFECDGVRILIDEKSLLYLDGTELDYKREGLQEGFQFNNPNVKETCGCGESFVV